MIGLGEPPPVAVGVAFVWLVGVVSAGTHNWRRMTTYRALLAAVFRGSVLGWGAALAVLWLLAMSGPRAPLGLGFVAGLGLLLSWRALFFAGQTRLPQAVEPVLVVGTGPDARVLAERVARGEAGRLQIVGYIRTARAEEDLVEPILGTLEDLRGGILGEARTLILATRQLERVEALRLASWCSSRGLRVLQTPFTWGLVTSRPSDCRVGRLDLVDIGGLGYPTWARAIKRAFDVAAVLVGGALLLPLLVVLALAVRLTDGGPVFYVSQRAGKSGESFGFVKFRSMRVGAELERASLANEADGRLFKMADDPRVTALGAFLRRWSLDELPQLWNVLKGDMNLVGPRPLPMEDLAGIEGDPEHWFWFEQRSRVKPGITGPWQVAGRSDLAFERMVDLDVHYIQQWSLVLDLQILARTIPAVLRGRGAR